MDDMRLTHRGRCLALWAVLPAAGLGVLALLSPAPALGQEPEAGPMRGAKWLSDRGPFDPRPYTSTLLGTGLLDADYFDFKNRLWVEHGLSFGGYVSANFQWGSEGGPTHGISETLLLGGWEPLRSPTTAGRLVVGVAHDLTFGHPTTREFADRQGLVETPNDLDTHPDLTFTTLGLLHWEQEFWTGTASGWGIRAGQIYGPSYFGPARYLDDDRRFFMARPLAAAGGAQWVGYQDIGLGLNGIAWSGPWYVSLGFIDAQANRQFLDFASLMDGQFLYLGEVGFERDVDGPNEAALRLTVSHLDLDDGENPLLGPGQSMMISGDRRFNGQWALAGRWSRSFNRRSADHAQLFSLGALWLDPVDRPQDLSGLGVFTGDPSEDMGSWESGAEYFYRMQLTHGISVMVDIQFWWRTNSPTTVRTWVWGLRSELEF